MNKLKINQLVKYILSILFFTTICLSAHSQAMLALLFGKNIHNDNLSLGIHVGLAGSDLTSTPGSKLLPGLDLGAYTNVVLSAKWTLSNYFIFKSSRGASSIPLDHQIQQDVPGAASATIKRKLTYMEISPLMRYNLTAELSVAAGPQVGIRTVAKDIYDITVPNGGKENIVYGLGGSYCLLDLDAAADIQYAFYEGKGVRVNLRFSQGLTNIYKDAVPFQAHNQYIQLGVGIPISIGNSQ